MAHGLQVTQAASVFAIWQIGDRTGSVVANRAGSREHSSRSGREHKSMRKKQSRRFGRGRGSKWHSGTVQG